MKRKVGIIGYKGFVGSALFEPFSSDKYTNGNSSKVHNRRIFVHLASLRFNYHAKPYKGYNEFYVHGGFQPQGQIKHQESDKVLRRFDYAKEFWKEAAFTLQL